MEVSFVRQWLPGSPLPAVSCQTAASKGGDRTAPWLHKEQTESHSPYRARKDRETRGPVRERGGDTAE